MSETATIVWITLKVGLAGLALSFVPGLALAWLLAKRRFPGHALLQTLVGLPLVLPPVAVGLLLLYLFGRRGPAGALLHGLLGWDLLFTWQAAALASSVMAFPLLVRSAQQAFAEVPERLEQVASSLGAGRWRVFRTVTLPLARRGVVYGTVLCLTRGLGEFGATNLIAGTIPGRTETLSLGIYGRVQSGHDGAAFGLAAISLAIAFAATYLSELYLARRARAGRFGDESGAAPGVDVNGFREGSGPGHGKAPGAAGAADPATRDRAGGRSNTRKDEPGEP